MSGSRYVNVGFDTDGSMKLFEVGKEKDALRWSKAVIGRRLERMTLTKFVEKLNELRPKENTNNETE